MLVKHAQSERHHILLLGVQASDVEHLSEGKSVKIEAELDNKVWSILVMGAAVQEDLQRELDAVIKEIYDKGQMP